MGAALLITALMGLVVLFSFLFILGIAFRWSQQWVALVGGMLFLSLGAALDLYRRFFVPDILIQKRRWKKFVTRRHFDYEGGLQYGQRPR